MSDVFCTLRDESNRRQEAALVERSLVITLKTRNAKKILMGKISYCRLGTEVFVAFLILLTTCACVNISML